MTKTQNKNDLKKIERALKNKREKIVAMVAPSFIVDFSYPSIISQLKHLGFKKVVELTFGAKMINREYHKILVKSKELLIASACPGIVESVKKQFPQYKKNIAKINSPMIATAKVCRSVYPKYKVCFISPCHMKKIEVQGSEFVDYVMDYQQLHYLFAKHLIPPSNHEQHFDKFYNDYTKIYPLSGGLSKTAHLMQVIKPGQEKVIDGWKEVEKFLKKPDKNIKFLDVTFCKGGCIGGPCTSKISLRKKRKLLHHYLEHSKHEKIPQSDLGLVVDAKGIEFTS